ncbi:MAG: CAP domain-containing protein, partial [Conexibacter sp.]
VLCRMNRVRRRAGLRPLRVNRCLDRGAEQHTRDMIWRRYFAHGSARGGSFAQRAQRFGYIPRAPGWRVGENLAWGTGSSGRARWFVRAWMHSPGHRANILSRSFRDVGIAVLRGTPLGIRGRHPRTITVDFGARGRAAC